MTVRQCVRRPLGMCLAVLQFRGTLFANIVNRDDAAAEVYSRMPMVSAEGPHKLQRKGLLQRFDSEAQEILADPKIPVHKLTWKLAESSIPKHSILSHIIELGGK